MQLLKNVKRLVSSWQQYNTRLEMDKEACVEY